MSALRSLQPVETALNDKEAPFMRIPVLVYHQIAGRDHSGCTARSRALEDHFERQMRYLHDHEYSCLALADLLSPSRPCAKKRPFVLTFDDGYVDYLERAHSVLQSCAFTATVFLVADRVGGRSDWDGERGSALLSWQQVRALQREGVTFGSHTCTHPHLPSLSVEQVRRELCSSRRRLEDELGHEVAMLCYPHGESNQVIREIAAEVGYKAACGSLTGPAGPFNIWRWPCRAYDSMPTVLLRLSPWYRRYRRLRRWAREESALGRIVGRAKQQWSPAEACSRSGGSGG